METRKKYSLRNKKDVTVSCGSKLKPTKRGSTLKDHVEENFKESKLRKTVDTTDGSEVNENAQSLVMETNQDNRIPCIKVEADSTCITVPFAYVVSVCCVDQYTMWIGNNCNDTNGSNGLRKIKVDLNRSRKVITVKEYSLSEVDMYDFHYDFDSDQIFYTNRHRAAVITIDSMYNEMLVKDVQPMKPTCIHVVCDYIYVGLIKNYGYKQTFPSKIIKLKKDGSVVMEIPGFNHLGRILFVVPHRVIINNYNNDIIVAGADSPENGAIIIFNSEGFLKRRYCGTVKKTTFKPSCVTCSEEGDIICANDITGDVHILDNSGQCLKVLMRGTEDINRVYGIPCSLSWDYLGRLVFGLKVPIGQGRIQFSKYIANT